MSHEGSLPDLLDEVMLIDILECMEASTCCVQAGENTLLRKNLNHKKQEIRLKKLGEISGNLERASKSAHTRQKVCAFECSAHMTKRKREEPYFVLYTALLPG